MPPADRVEGLLKDILNVLKPINPEIGSLSSIRPLPFSIMPWDTSFLVNQAKITTADKAVNLLSLDQPTLGILVKALKDNENVIYLGRAGVTSDSGFELEAGDAVIIGVNNAKENVYIVGSTAGDGVCFVALPKEGDKKC